MNARSIMARFLAYSWAAPNTAVGAALGLVMLCLGGRLRFSLGAAEFAGGLIGRLIASIPGALRFEAVALGHVIVGISEIELSLYRAHERAHVRQYEKWGVFFMPAYALSSIWQAARGRRGYRDNYFERQAYAVEAVRGERTSVAVADS